MADAACQLEQRQPLADRSRAGGIAGMLQGGQQLSVRLAGAGVAVALEEFRVGRESGHAARIAFSRVRQSHPCAGDISGRLHFPDLIGFLAVEN